MPAPLFTVFTPTYNRAHTLHRVWESLRAQTLRDFEWLLVDDGSTDGTEDLVSGWKAEAGFPVRYVRQENQGKHVAMRRAADEARGALFLTLDSDDGCVPEALERFRWHWESIPPGRRGGFAGVTARCRRPDGSPVGPALPAAVVDSNTVEMLYRYRMRAERWGFVRTDVVRRYSFPAATRTYLPEGLVWFSIARDFQTRYVNEVLRIYYPEQGSISRTRAAVHAAGMQAMARLTLNDHLSAARWAPWEFVLEAGRYTRASLHLGHSLPAQWGGLRPAARPLWVAALPIGAAMWLRDRRG